MEDAFIKIIKIMYSIIFIKYLDYWVKDINKYLLFANFDINFIKNFHKRYFRRNIKYLNWNDEIVIKRFTIEGIRIKILGIYNLTSFTYIEYSRKKRSNYFFEYKILKEGVINLLKNYIIELKRFFLIQNGRK